MSEATQKKFQPAPPPPAEYEGPFLVSNAMLLSGRQLLGLALFAASVVVLFPILWARMEPLDPEPDDRVPYELSQDYWLFERIADDAAAGHEVLLLGDSVIWGQYVRRDETLSHYLNEGQTRERFRNLGIDGMHPAALAGLIEHYAKGISKERVLLHFNPLWLSEAKLDLQEEDEFRFNHPGLVPQFSPSIPCYREEVSRRLGLIVERNLPFFQWTSHMQLAYVDQTNLPEWSLEHPYTLPWKALEFRLPPSDGRLRHRPVPWTQQGIRKQDFAWVDLKDSFQWRSFRRALDLLRERGNRVFVLVGPFNEHMLTERGLHGYERIRDGVAAWLKDQGVPFDAPPALPSERYADASHPLAEGYREMAERLIERLAAW